MPVVVTVPVVFTSVPQRETPGSLLAHPHSPEHLVSSPALAALVRSIVAPPSRYAASYNYFESCDLGFTDMELESEVQLLPPPIRRHPAQSYTLGTDVVDTRNQIDVGRGASTQIISAASYSCILRVLLCQQFDVMCPFLLNLIGITNTSLHLYPHPHLHLHSHRCPWNPLHLPISLTLGISTWEHNNRYSRLCENAANAADAVYTADAGAPWLLMYAVPSNESYQHHQYCDQYRPSFHSHDWYQGRPHTRINIRRQVNAHKCQSSR